MNNALTRRAASITGIFEVVYLFSGMINLITSISLTHNSIYSIHYSYYSIEIIICIINIFIIL